MVSRNSPFAAPASRNSRPAAGGAMVRAAGLGLALLAAAGAPSPAAAAEAASAAARKSYAIAPGPRGDVLAQFAAASGVPLSFDPAMLSGRRSGG